MLPQLVTLVVLSNLIVSETDTAHSAQLDSVLHTVMVHVQPTVTVVETSMDVDHASMVFANNPLAELLAFLALIILAMASMVALTVIQAPILQILVPLENLATQPVLSILTVIKLEHVLFVPMESASVITLDVEPPVSLEMMDLALLLLAPTATLKLETLAPRVILAASLAH